jgi:glucose-1-phosphate adenylyltransferase
LFTNYPEATDFGKGIIPAAIQSGLRTASYKYNGYWTDIGSIKSFYEANIALTKHLPEFNLFDNVKQIYTRPRLLPPSKIFGTKFNQSILADGCIVHAKFVNNSIVGIRSRIGEKSSLDHVIMMGSDYYETLEQIVNSKDIPPIGIGKNSKISNAILDKNCRVGNNVVIEGGDHLANTEEKSYCIVDGIVVVKKNAVIADGTVIGAKK